MSVKVTRYAAWACDRCGRTCLIYDDIVNAPDGWKTVVVESIGHPMLLTDYRPQATYCAECVEVIRASLEKTDD